MNWISVKDKLPEDDKLVLVYLTSNYFDLLKREKDCLWHDSYGALECSDASITHWMPLPEPPEDGV